MVGAQGVGGSQACTGSVCESWRCVGLLGLAGLVLVGLGLVALGRGKWGLVFEWAYADLVCGFRTNPNGLERIQTTTNQNKKKIKITIINKVKIQDKNHTKRSVTRDNDQHKRQLIIK